MRLLSPARLFLLLAGLSLATYLAVSGWAATLGYPLDDAWIHQTYARNLAWRGEFAFVPGQPSAGSTAPLWSALLAVGYLVRLEPRLWTYGLGGLNLALTAWLTWRLVLDLWPERRLAALAAGAAVALEWHLAWAAVSGMETGLFAALALAAFVVPARRPAWLGVLVGVSVLVRPDGLTLLPFALARVLAGAFPNGPAGGWDLRRLRPGLALLAGFAAVFGPYLVFNVLLAGSPWPNTFYAKQAEYAEMRDLPLLWRLGSVGLQPLIGAQLLAVPGLFLAGWEAVRGRRLALALPGLWAGACVAAYVLRLPVVYQYGRYVMPVIPVLVAVGVGGLGGRLRWGAARLGPRLFSRPWAAALGVLLVVFWGWGALLYRRDVRIIESEMVAAARWINQNT
ncbi:MAG: hypothetical protein JNK29_10755, partial [Anaerolineales bacterium]|nr:hypothetical protein [Anaerolineales bacterium]